MAMENARVVIEGVRPQVECGRFPAKRVIGDTVRVEADVFTDGHEALSCSLRYRFDSTGSRWQTSPMEPLPNDRWYGSFEVTALGTYVFTVEAWIDHYKGWVRDFGKRMAAGQDLKVELLIGARLAEAAASRANSSDRKQILEFAEFLRSKNPVDLKSNLVMDPEMVQLIQKYPDERYRTTFERELQISVERAKARFSTWYELFPRSCGKGRKHGTFDDCAGHLEQIAEMGFDVVYLPPIHPIGVTKRKGKNNAIVAKAGDCGSPWAIGGSDGGHKGVHPELGTLEDFRRLARAAEELGLEVALDIALQCSPDHPYVREHPEWFRERPDGTVQYAENPPKKYEDIYPFDFETETWQELWEELKSIFEFWIDEGIRIFRVDNPHTKSLPFWEWLISQIRKRSPEVIFLSEAFTRPKVMYRLAKLGFSQSYTYFTWRNTKWELTQYFEELTGPDVIDFFRSNCWPNTPDILSEYLQTGGRNAFVTRLILAGTLSASYGIYGPAFELGLNTPREPHSEEYLDSEKYEIKDWAFENAAVFRDLISRLNQIRRENPALQSNDSLRFHPIDNDQLLCFSKQTGDGTNLILVVVNLDPHHINGGWLDLPLEYMGVTGGQSYQAHDLLSDARFLWHGSRNYVELNPHVLPAHLFKILRRVRREQDFEYFL